MYLCSLVGIYISIRLSMIPISNNFELIFMKCLVRAINPISYFSIKLVKNLVIFDDFIYSTKLNYSSLEIDGHRALILSRIITEGCSSIAKLYFS